jgi:hypothetical protein
MTSNEPLSFVRDIRPLFTDMDVDHMKNVGIDLSDHADVKDNADAIYSTVSERSMPPPGIGEPQWTDEMCETFKAWQSQGCPP